ncbi:MAG: hydrogenase iron-sulfur subunit [Proteobacteria bacterium]|nr:hydrogenase iron-sulfur subunit [Pseudomonadota bacterium]MBU1060254.1 hydrogenase iron-sulfur subunit [Pseudomonadota bacterium]
MSFDPAITLFSCHYTSQQSCAEEGKELEQLGFPSGISMVRVPCTGKLQVTTLLKAFEDGADGVYVVGCPVDGCHNVKGSARAAKRVAAVRAALQELGVEGERIEMFHLARGLHPEFVEKGKEMAERIRDLGPSPF